MTITYEFKTTEDIDTKSRTIVKIEPVVATTQETEFTLESKENELTNAEQALVDAQKRVTDLTKEIADIKTALSIK